MAMAMATIYYCSYSSSSSSSSWSWSSRRSFFFLSFAPSSPIILDNYFNSTSSSPQKLSAQVWQPHILPSIPRCLAVNVRDLESSTSDFSSIDDTVITETKRKASSIDKGLDLVAFYSDHHGLPTFQGLDKCQATRLLLESDDAASQNLLTTLPSPLAFPEELCLVYDERYIKDLIDREWKKEKLHHLGFECSHELVTRSRASTGGTIAAMHVVMLGLRLASANISGHGFLNPVKGYHLVPSGIFNDITVATSVALQCYPQICNSKRPVLVINLDVYQKESMLRLFEKDSRVVTFNLHGTSTSHHGSSLLDCTGDDYYIAMLSKKLDQLFDLHNPGLVFFQAGVDARSEDVSGQFSMTRQGLLHRNNIVYTCCFTHRTPLVITMGSGYSNPWQACIEAHADVFRAAALRYGTTG